MHASISDQLLDLVQNAIEAKASKVELTLRESEDRLEVDICDDGCGMSPEQQSLVLDPFYSDGTKHAHRKIGLGLSFLKQMTDAVDGNMALCSELGKGTRVHFRLPVKHPDVPPVGELAESFVAMMVFEGDYELKVQRFKDDEGYLICRSELKEALGELQTVASVALVKAYTTSQEEALQTLVKG